MSWLFPAESQSSGGFLVPERKNLSSGVFFVYELNIPGGISSYPVEGECWQSADEIHPMDSSSMSW
jgi:hypothetical protein